MIDDISGVVAQKILDAGIIRSEDHDIYYYGLQLVVSTIIKVFGLIFIAVLFKKVIEAVIFLTVFGFMRINAGGLHLDTYMKCFIATAASMMLIIWAGSSIPSYLSFYIISVALAISFLLIIRYAPVDNPNRTLSKREHGIYRKRSIYAITIQIIIIVTAYFINIKLYRYCSIASLSVLFESLTLLPLASRCRQE